MSAPEPLVMVYDLSDAVAWQQARRDRCTWGKLYTDIHRLDCDHVALVFRSGGERWHPWEQVRRRWILDGEVA